MTTPSKPGLSNPIPKRLRSWQEQPRQQAGPLIVSVFGDALYPRGGVAAMAGMLLAPTVVVLTLAVAAAQLRDVPQVAGALRGMGVVAAGLILSTALKLAPGLSRSVVGVPASVGLVVLTVAAVGLLRWPLAAVVLGLGVVAIGWAWRRSAP
jgi:chromate transporter